MGRWWTRWRLRLRARRFDAELREEVETHRAMAEADLAAGGADPSHARRQAARVLGNDLYHRETARLVALGPFFRAGEEISRDARHALRRLRGSPTFSAFSVITLAVGIGVTTSITAIVRTILGPTPGVPNIERVVNVQRDRPGSQFLVALSWPDYEDLRARQTVFSAISPLAWNGETIAGPGSTESGFGELVGGDYFRVLGVKASIGRTLQPMDDDPGAPLAAVISDALWQRMFNRAPSAVGSVIKINGLACTIVGVADAAFSGSFQGGLIPSVSWITIGTSRLLSTERTGRDFGPDREHRWILVKALLADGRSLADARAEAQRIGHALDEAYPLGDRSSRSMRRWDAQRMADAGRLDFVTNAMFLRVAVAVLVVVVLVLLVACTNLANLNLARWTNRRHDVATRLALGASRGRLVREILLETTLLVAAGAILGVVLAVGVIRTLTGNIPITGGIAARLEPHLDLFSIAMAVIASALSAIVAGMLPALQATRLQVRAGFMDITSATTARWRGRPTLIAAQATVSAMLLVVAALGVRQAYATPADLGAMNLDNVAYAHVDFGGQQYDETHARQAAETVVQAISRQPGVAGVAVAAGIPGFSTTAGASVARPGAAPISSVVGQFIVTSPELFSIIGLHATQGRLFDARDRRDATPVVVLDEATAERLFGGSSPIGEQIQLRRGQWTGEAKHPDELRTVVGVVANANGAGSAGGRVIYVPYAQDYEREVVFVARTTGSLKALPPAMVRTIRSVVPDLGVMDWGPAAVRLNSGTIFFGVMAALASVLGVFALLLSAAGLYGVLSHLVALRTREIGLRMALGGETSDIRRMILRQGLQPIVIGLVAGIGLGAIPRLAMRPQFRTLLPAFDLPATLIVVALFLSVGGVASYWPARRASKVDPNVALKNL